MKRILLGICIIIFVALVVSALKTSQRFVPVPEGTVIDYVLVEKSKHLMTVYSKNQAVKTYKISLGFNPKGRKQFEGDKKTPEGLYAIDSKNPNSGFYLNLGISYPNQEDKIFAESQGKSPGGDIKIHGLMNGLGFIGSLHRLFDWTAGCIALTNREVSELYQYIPIGTPIDIRE